MKDDPLLNPDTNLEFETNMNRIITGICSDNQSTSTNCYKNSLYIEICRTGIPKIFTLSLS